MDLSWNNLGDEVRTRGGEMERGGERKRGGERWREGERERERKDAI